MNLTIRVDVKDALGFFDRLHQQAPYAVSKGLNDLMLHGERQVQAQLPEHFTLRRKTFVERTVKVRQWASKRNLAASIGIDPSRNFLGKFEAGGTKTPRGNFLTVPIAVRRTKSDIVVKSMRVRELQLRAHRTASGKVQLRGKQRTFAIKGPTGGAILQRFGRRPKGTATLSEEIRRGTVRVAYAFTRSVPIPASLHFAETFRRDAKHWPEIMAAAWEYALATARR
ncbi:MAG TPA: hypothetical protein PKA66_07360 [Gemmatimonadales bacterium]|nr:hypothetical protein [Gemmatimonadales bacterium]